MSLVRGLTIGGMLHQKAEQYPDRPALIFQNRTWTYSELDSETDSVAKGMLASGIKKGEHVALWCGNNPYSVITLYALLKIGAVPAMIGLRDKSSDLWSRVRQAGADYLFFSRTIRNLDAYKIVCSGNRDDLKETVLIDRTEEEGIPGLEDIKERGKRITQEQLEEAKDRVHDFDPDLMLFTSGSSGTPKAVMHTHFARINNAINQAEALHVTCGDRFMCAMPLFHCFALNAVVFCALTQGACLCLPDNYHTAAVLEGIQRYRCTVFMGVPTIFSVILSRKDLDTYDLSSLRTGIMAGSCYPPALFKKVKETLQYDLVPALGLTETTGGITCAQPDAPEEILTRSVGKLLPHMEAKICGRNKETLAAGEQGEICVRGYCVMDGYYNSPEINSRVFDEEGFFHTGDMGYMDADGNLFISGRIKDLIIRGGENISPSEIEEVISEDPEVQEAAVISVPDPHYMEEICACFTAPGSVEEDRIRELAAKKLAKYKVPRYVLQFDSFPRTSTGKVDKRALRKEAIKRLGIKAKIHAPAGE